jgi:hypothetical protein
MIKNLRILYLHSNASPLLQELHASRVRLYNSLGFKVRLVDSTRHFRYANFPRLDRLWKRKDPSLTKFYETIGEELDACDLFIHYNGANIHPRFLEQFRCFKVYHCADDPEASNFLSRPVANYYDVCAVSNVACLDLYRTWGCKKVFFWPLGSSFADESINSVALSKSRDTELVFVGSKTGVPSIRYFGRFLHLYKRRGFLSAVERNIPSLTAYGYGWKKGTLPDEELATLYARARLGLNKHNSLGRSISDSTTWLPFLCCRFATIKNTLKKCFL